MLKKKIVRGFLLFLVVLYKLFLLSLLWLSTAELIGRVLCVYLLAGLPLYNLLGPKGVTRGVRAPLKIGY